MWCIEYGSVRRGHETRTTGTEPALALGTAFTPWMAGLGLLVSFTATPAPRTLSGRAGSARSTCAWFRPARRHRADRREPAPRRRRRDAHHRAGGRRPPSAAARRRAAAGRAQDRRAGLPDRAARRQGRSGPAAGPRASPAGPPSLRETGRRPGVRRRHRQRHRRADAGRRGLEPGPRTGGRLRARARSRPDHGPGTPPSTGEARADLAEEEPARSDGSTPPVPRAVALSSTTPAPADAIPDRGRLGQPGAARFRHPHRPGRGAASNPSRRMPAAATPT